MSENLFTPAKVVKGSLIGIDGNAFSVLGYFRSQARDQGWDEADIDIVLAEAKSGNYENLMVTIVNHLES